MAGGSYMGSRPRCAAHYMGFVQEELIINCSKAGNELCHTM